MRFLTAGESHGQALIAIIDGFPAGVPIAEDYVSKNLTRRQMGYGRGGRMAIESDACEFLAGVRHGYTTGGPISLLVRNRDWVNWEGVMAPQPPESPLCEEAESSRVLTRPRPGHADLPGSQKYRHADIRDVLERASARETAARVAVGAVCLRILEEFGASVASHVTSIGNIGVDMPYERRRLFDDCIRENRLLPDSSSVRCLDPELSACMEREIDRVKAEGDSVGGSFEVLAFGLPPGLGTYAQWDRRLDTRLAAAVMSIQAIRGVEFGLGFMAGELVGSQVHDEIISGGAWGFARTTNRSGGVEGGMSNGEPLILRAAMKPIPTLYRPLKSVDIRTGELSEAGVERSDVCAVPAASIVGEAMVAWVLADAYTEKFGGDSLSEMKSNFVRYTSSLVPNWRR